LILEEPDFAIEIQIPDREGVEGRLSGHVPAHGELTPEVIADLLGRGRPPRPAEPGPPPRLCLGCGHRAAFLAIHQALPRAIYSGDIGCYTLGVNQRTLDTCLDMGASITLAEGFFHAHRRDANDKPVVAIIGDSTFFHSGMTGLLNCVNSDARIVVVVLDNGTVAMTGAQPTPAKTGASIEAIARALGVGFVEAIDPYEIADLTARIRAAHEYTQRPDGGPAVVVARRPCVLRNPPVERVAVDIVADECIACSYCLNFLACPALVEEETGKVHVDYTTCVECGLCLSACPVGAIVPKSRVETT
jgi:indolepyruvate ferredoxin oxidoreductase alpha subunit